MELRDLILKHRKTCDCGHEFSNQDIQPPIIMNKDYKYYGGRVECYVKTKCPNCGQEVYILLESYDNKYRVIDIAEDPNKPEAIEEPIVEEKQEETIEKTQEEIQEGFICDNCGREFKSKSGLTSHKRKCK